MTSSVDERGMEGVTASLVMLLALDGILERFDPSDDDRRSPVICAKHNHGVSDRSFSLTPESSRGPYVVCSKGPPYS